jgi:hypothetical protein
MLYKCLKMPFSQRNSRKLTSKIEWQNAFLKFKKVSINFKPCMSKLCLLKVKFSKFTLLQILDW